MKIAGATVNQTPMDWSGNAANIVEATKKAKEEQVDLICFPELSICGYGCEDNFLSDWLWQYAFETLNNVILPETAGISICVGTPIKYKDKLYNAAIYIKDGEIQFIIPKQNLANDGVHYEPRWFTAWPSGVKSEVFINGRGYAFGDYIIEDLGEKIAFEICEDAWRTIRPGIKHAEKGVGIILNPSASHFALRKSETRQQLVIDSSKQFNCTYLYTNLLGNEAGRMIYDGEILIATKGELLQRNELLSFQHYNLVTQDLSADSTPIALQTSNSNSEFHKATALALFDYLKKSKSNGFVLSLSGGADSSCCALIVSEMVRIGLKTLGLHRFLEGINHSSWFDELKDDSNKPQTICSRILTTAYQGTKNSGTATLEAATALAEEIGATFHYWTIDDEVEGYSRKIEQALQRKLTWETDDITLQNIQARARSPIIWMLANIQNALLLTTSNRSEGSVGYTTMDGDTSGSIAPIAAIDKPFIIQWLKWAETVLGYGSLNYVNSLAPTAELRPSNQTQTDETDLMPYPTLLAIEQEAIQKHKSPVEVYKALFEKFDDKLLLKHHIEKFFKLWTRNQWKRERLAPSFHLDDYNVDPKTWCRFPILSSGFTEE
ncbi:MAG: NAD+ synthase (glutamine-hydrolyzing), partial [Marivirga sp.]